MQPYHENFGAAAIQGIAAKQGAAEPLYVVDARVLHPHTERHNRSGKLGHFDGPGPGSKRFPVKQDAQQSGSKKNSLVARLHLGSQNYI